MNQLSTEVLRLDTRIDNVSDDLDKLDKKVDNSEMQEIHEEIHEVAMAVDNLDASVSPKVRTLENKAYDFQLNISNLHKEDKDIWDAMKDMDVEHHEELHRLALSIDNHESRINDIETHWINYEKEIDDVSTGLANVTTIVNNLPPHIVLTKEEYDDLDNPDYNSFYFTYED